MSIVRRILLCCEHYPPSIGGVQEVMRQIAERFVTAGLEVTVATSVHPERPAVTIRNGVHVVSFSISGNRVRGMRGPIQDYQSLLVQGHFDAVLIKAAQQWTFDAAVDVLPYLNCRKFFIPCGFSGLNEPSYIQYYKEMPEWLRLFNGLIFYSNEYQDINFARHYGLTHLHCLPNGVDECEFADLETHGIRETLGIAPDHDLLLSVGSLIAAKGHWEVLRAFFRARLSKPATLVINGKEPTSNFVHNLMRTVKQAISGRWPLSLESKWFGMCGAITGPNKRVILTNLPRVDLVNLYKASDLFIFASHVEYSPLVLFEAAAAGTAFLASPAGNSREIAKWTGAGRVLENIYDTNAAAGIKSLSRELEMILSDPICLSIMGSNGRLSIFEKGFTWDKIVDNYLKIIDKYF